MTTAALRQRILSRGWGAGPHILGALLILALFGGMAIEPTRQLLRQRELVADMSKDLGSLERSNERLEDRIVRLRDPDYLEQRARAQMGLVRPGETTYVVMPPSRKERREERRPRKETPVAEAPEPSFLQSFLAFVGI